jgi:SAM-dependent methyltransferase
VTDPGQARSFGAEAERYDSYRPDYPSEAIDWALDGRHPELIVDVGAGTGKLTTALLGRARQIVAVEPDPNMLAVLADRLDGVSARAGSAEQLPLPDGSADAIFAGQSFHWFARPAADYELARVLKPGGVLALIWNFPAPDEPWLQELYRITRPGITGPTPIERTWDAPDRGLFTPEESAWFDSEHRLSGPDAVLNLVHTWSWVITQPPAAQAEIDAAVRQQVAELPHLQGDQVSFPQRTKVARHRRR